MSIELKRKKLELARVSVARQEQEFKIEEKMEEIERLNSLIVIQKNKENDLKLEIKTLENKGE
jgi:hypothetical protein